MVVFFVSYDYLDKVVNHFKKNNLLAQLNENKQVFYEPKLSSDSDRVFSEYTKCIRVICFKIVMIFDRLKSINILSNLRNLRRVQSKLVRFCLRLWVVR